MRGFCISLSPPTFRVVDDGVGGKRKATYKHKKKSYQYPLSLSHHHRCSALPASSLSLERKEEEEEKKWFDEKEAGSLVKELRDNFYKSRKTRSYEWRISQLKSIIKMIDENETQITEALHQDLSKPPLESFLSEISNAKSSCEFALKELKNWMQPQKAETSISTYPSSAKIVSEPLGVVLVISTWNFPFLLSVEPVIGAIAAGNAVVLKPSEIAPATSHLLVKLFEKYLDPSAIRVVEGAVPQTSALLDQHWDKILYTGSSRVGRIVMSAAAKHLTPVILELGGKCPAVVDSNIDLQVAMRRIIAGKWQANNGQACIGVDYIITTKDFAPKLIDGLIKEIENCFGKSPIKSKDISRIVSITHYNRLVSLLKEDKVFDKIVFGGETDDTKLRIAPTILLNVPQHTQIMQEEIFGPLLPIVTVENVRECFEVINSKPKPLAAYLFTNDDNLKEAFVENVSSGGMLINDTVLHVTLDSLPFGGVGESGMGSYHGKFSFDAFSHKKSVLYRSFSGDASLRYPPYTPTKQKLMKALMNDGPLGMIPALLGWS
ncbi:Aldehyde dehydrogenase [Euphorbia peplus]|nr:Aldehyde dehydrogenase [Euphorbia peplus]